MADTVTVKRGGSFLTIPALAVDRYLAKGYVVVDANGNPIQTEDANDAKALKQKCDAYVAEIKKLKAEISELKAKLEEYSQPVKVSKLFGAEAEESEVEAEPIEKPVEKKKASKQSKKSV